VTGFKVDILQQLFCSNKYLSPRMCSMARAA